MNPGAHYLWEYALWGAFGGVAIETIEILGATKRVKALPWRVPGEVSAAAMMFCIAIRLALGAGLAVVLGQSGQISGGLGAMTAGVAAPLILEQMSKQIPAPMATAAAPARQPAADQAPPPTPVPADASAPQSSTLPAPVANERARRAPEYSDDPGAVTATRPPAGAEPATDTERRLAKALAMVLKVPQVPVDAHIIDELGATDVHVSVFFLTAQVPRLGASDIHQYPTIRALAEYVSTTPALPAEPPSQAEYVREDVPQQRTRRSAEEPALTVERARRSAEAQARIPAPVDAAPASSDAIPESDSSNHTPWTRQVLAGLARSTPAFRGWPRAVD
jgi:hypothetical protein